MYFVNFSNESLKTIDPARLIYGQVDKVADFFLVLGLFYNDLKNLNFHVIQTNTRFKSINKKKASSYAGEYGGIMSHLQRLFAATLHDFFRFIKENETVLKTAEFNLLYKELNKDLKDRWDLIVKISTSDNPGDSSDFSKILLLIRNNLAFHYYQSSKSLRKGFIDRFFNDDKNISNETAYYSIGSTMNNTRFFYCDTAAERSLLDQVTKKMAHDKYYKEFFQVVNHVNFTIMGLMREYLRQRPYPNKC